MRTIILPLAASVALLSSCANSIDDYHYGYAPAYRELPAGFAKVDVGGTPYWHHNGRFYQHDPARGYLLVKPPRGHEQVIAAVPGANAPSPNGPTTQTKTQSWIAPGGGTIDKQLGRPRTSGRSAIRRRHPVATE